MKRLTAALMGLTLMSGQAFAAGWTLNSDESRLAFASVKSEVIGEVHSFENLSGGVDEAGMATIEIDLASVQTNIDIRNERMIKYVFEAAPSAMIKAQIDMTAVKDLAPGESATVYTEATLSFLGIDNELDTDLHVVRLADNKVMVTTNDMIFVDTELLEIDLGVDKLMELASLESITRAVPVTLRLVYDVAE